MDNFRWKILAENIWWKVFDIKKCNFFLAIFTILEPPASCSTLYLSLSWSLSSPDDKLSENIFVWSKMPHSGEKVGCHA